MVSVEFHVHLRSCPIEMEVVQLVNAKLALPLLIPAQVAFLQSPICIIAVATHSVRKGHMPILHQTVLTVQTTVLSVLPNQFVQSVKRIFIYRLTLIFVYQIA